MNYFVHRAIQQMLHVDASLSREDKRKILAVCERPGMFAEPVEHILPRVLTLGEVCKATRTSRTSVWRAVKAGRLRQLGYSVSARFLAQDVENFILGRVPPPPDGGEKHGNGFGQVTADRGAAADAGYSDING